MRRTMLGFGILSAFFIIAGLPLLSGCGSIFGDDDDIFPSLDAMTGFEAHAYSDGTYLTWNSMLGSTSVVIRRSTSSYPTGPSDGVEVYIGFGQHHFDTGLTMGQTYYYTAFAYNSSSDYSSAVHASITMAPLTPAGWLGGGNDGWHTALAPPSGTVIISSKFVASSLSN